jgi:phage gp46-like protein
MKSTRQLQEQIERRVVSAAGAIRRMAVTLSAKALWQLTGFRLVDENGQVKNEVALAEAFTGIGFYARPPEGGKPEAIVINVNDAQHPVAIAVRDEKTRQAVAGALKLDESAMFNTVAIVVVKSNGTVEIRSAGGTAEKLVTQAQFLNHTHLTAGTNLTGGARACGHVRSEGGVMPCDWRRDPVTGDFVRDGKGGFVRVFTAEASVQNQLLAHEGECWQDPLLGSKLHDLKALQRDPLTLAPQAAERALARLEAAGRITAVETEAEIPFQGRVNLATRFRDTSTGQLIDTFVKAGG